MSLGSKAEVSGVKLSVFEDPIHEALLAYEAISYDTETGNRIEFDHTAATELIPTPEGPEAYRRTSAKSVSEVKHLGEKIGNLYVVLFAEGDGTGDEADFAVSELTNGGYYPLAYRTVPRSKAAVESEAHLTIASKHPDSGDSDPIMFAGSLDLIGLVGGRLRWLATLGQDSEHFMDLTDGFAAGHPTATLTTGYRKLTGERFGDPHAVYNDTRVIQVCGFLGISWSMAISGHVGILNELYAKEPRLRFKS